MTEDTAGNGHGHWLTAERIRIYPTVILITFTVAAIYWILQADGLIDSEGNPLAYDFMAYWGASYLTLQGAPLQAFDIIRMAEVQRMVAPELTTYHPWLYPPTFLLLVTPWALLPYGWSALLWISTTLAAHIAVIRKLVPAPHIVLLTLAFPATFLNAIHGQNGFLIAALFGGAMYFLERRPIVAGLLIGLLSFKPHLGLLIPLALILGRHWTAFTAAAVTSIVFALISVLAFGPDMWLAFKDNAPLAILLLEQEGNLTWEKMPALFPSMRMMGFGVTASYAVQYFFAACAAIGVAWIWWRRAPVMLGAAVLVSGTLLTTPYLFDYDLVLLGIPVAILAWDGYRNGWLPGEREFLVLAWLSPLLTFIGGMATGLPFGVLFLIGVFGLALWRAELAVREREGRPTGAAVPEAG